MLTEDVFLAKLLETPTDDTTRLVYADWLDEQGDSESSARAEFLRLTVQLESSAVRKGRKKALRNLLQQRAAALDTDWLAVVSRLRIENCLDKRRKTMGATPAGLPPVTFDFVCDRRWEELKPSEDRGVRFCYACWQNVHYCDTITEARGYAAEGHCVAVDLGVIRRERDLDLRLMTIGFPSREEEELREPDPVSTERERRKREKAEGKEKPPSGSR